MFLPTAIDIETIPNDAMIPFLPEPEPAGNIKDPEKIKGDIAKKRVEQIEKMALSPLTGRVCAYSFYADGPGNAGYQVVSDISDESERLVVSGILKKLSTTGSGSPHIVTWNGIGFDLPFIYKRAMILRIPLPPGCFRLSALTMRYKRIPHCDLMQEFCSWSGRDFVSLDMASKVVLGTGKDARDYSKFVEMIQGGEGNKIGEACLCDSQLTLELFKVMSEYLF